VNVFHSDTFPLPLPPGHRFPIEKYERLRQQVQLEVPVRLHVAPRISEEELRLAHAADYVQRVFQGALTDREQRRIGFPWSAEFVERSRRSTGGTMAAARAALRDGVGVHLAGGTHHAFVDSGSGYCVFNDAAVAVRTLQAESRIRRAAVIDCDVHQGNGTAAIFAGDASVFTFSIHGANNFPFRKETSDWDIPLPDDVDDPVYLDALEPALSQIMDRARPDLVVYLAGADPYAGDRLGRLAISKRGLAERDRLVFEACRVAGVPVVVAMAGGYAKDVADTVEIQTRTVALAREIVAA
jgi:acetoin utilization deacetylase AcuC-like enzyme